MQASSGTAAVEGFSFWWQSWQLTFALAWGAGSGLVADCPVPYLADLSDIVDAAPETVSRVLASMREHDFLQDRKPQKARFSSQALKGLEMVAGMSAVRPARKLRAVLA